jgi:osmotically inducible protein OsmC
MKFSRNASATWKGSGRENGGTLTTQSGILSNTPYSFKMRFADEKGTNPEELIGAAHAGCFTMQLAVFLTDAGHDPSNLETKAKVTFEDGNITEIQLDLTASVPGMDEAQFMELAQKAKANCPVSKLLKANITLNAKFQAN